MPRPAVTGRKRGSAPSRRYVVGVADGAPDPARVEAGLERLLDRAPAEVGEDVVTRHRGGAGGAELLGHQLPELGESHTATLVRPRRRSELAVGVPEVATVSGMHLLSAAGDPTGFSSPLGQVVVLLALLSSLVLLLRWWWQQRRR